MRAGKESACGVMDEPPIHLGAREQRRARIVNAHLAGDLTVEQVATLLGVSERQVFRILARYRREGPASLVHTISFGGRSILLRPTDRRSLARARVEVQEWLDGSLIVLAHGEPVASVEAPAGPLTLRARSGPRSVEALGPEPPAPAGPTGREDTGPPARRAPWVPLPDHPWRR